MLGHASAHAAHASVPGSTDVTHHVVLEAATSRLECLVKSCLFKDTDIGVQRSLDVLNLGKEFVIDDSLKLSLVFGIEVVVSMVFDLSTEDGVVGPELPRVAALEDELLAVSDGLLQSLSSYSQLPDLLVLLVKSLLSFSLFLEGKLLLVVLVGSDLLSTSLHLLLKFNELCISFLLESSIKVFKTLLEFIAHLLDGISGGLLGILTALHGGLVLALGLCTSLSLSIKLGKFSVPGFVSGKELLKFGFFVLHLSDVVGLLFLKLLLVLDHFSLVFGLSSVKHIGHHGVGQEALKDSSLLSVLLLLDNTNLVTFSVHGLALDITSGSTFLLAVLFFKSSQVLFELAINASLLLDHFFNSLLVS